MSDDLISRKAVIEAVDRHTTEDGTLDEDISVILEEVKEHSENDSSVEEQSIEKRREISLILNIIFPTIFLALIVFAGVNPTKTDVLAWLAIPFALAAVFCLGLSG